MIPAPRNREHRAGTPPGEFRTPIFDVVRKRRANRGSIVGPRNDLQDALALAANSQVETTIGAPPLEAINAIFARFKTGDINGRVVMQIA